MGSIRNIGTWFPFLLFCVLCSCRSKKLDSSVATYDSNVATSLVDTARALRVFVDKSRLRIVETLKITEYDKESGKPVKETDAKREIVQDSDKVDSKEETEGIDITSQGAEKYSREIERKHFSETEEESVGAQESFGKRFGITLGVAIVVTVLYIIRTKSVNNKKGRS